MAEVALTLDTARVRRAVVVDGERYELRDPDELSLRETNRLQAMVKQVGEVMEGQDIPDERLAVLEAALDGCVAATIPGMPGEIRAKLTDAQRVKLIQAFTNARGPAPAAGEQAVAPAVS